MVGPPFLTVPIRPMKFFSRLFTPTNNKRLNELIGFLVFVAAVLLLLALASYSPLDPSFNTVAAPPESHPTRNWVGVVGANTSDLLLQFAGSPCSSVRGF